MRVNKKTTVTVTREELVTIKYLYDTIRMGMGVSPEEIGIVLHNIIYKNPCYKNGLGELSEFEYTE